MLRVYEGSRKPVPWWATAFIIISVVLISIATSPLFTSHPGTEAWCRAKMRRPLYMWSDKERQIGTTNCVTKNYLQ